MAIDSGKRCEILVLGDEQAPEFAGLRHFVSQHVLADQPAKRTCDLILLLAARPGRFSLAQVERLRARYPLARLAQVVGPWCYGEGRTGQPLPGVERVPWFAWPYRLPRLLAAQPSAPVTSAPQERVLTDLAELAARGPERAAALSSDDAVGVIAAEAASYGMIASACRALRVPLVWLEEPEQASNCSALVAVCAGVRGAEAERAAEMFRAAGSVPKVVCLGTPTVEDWHMARAWGATALLGQPFDLADLAAVLGDESEGLLAPV